jgi:acyl-[acyl-carrier-protein]-phospholipid O-acyltransferase/long-chain-fatty-acid--[acyl-carrier-protein] ligase
MTQTGFDMTSPLRSRWDQEGAESVQSNNEWCARACAGLLGTGLALLAALCGLAIAGGLFIVPSFAAVQAWAPVDRRARVIAAVNVLNAAYMVGAGGIVAGLQAAGLGVPELFAALGVLSIAAVAVVVRAWGGAVLRDTGRSLFTSPAA